LVARTGSNIPFSTATTIMLTAPTTRASISTLFRSRPMPSPSSKSGPVPVAHQSNQKYFQCGLAASWSA
jgi:hypothetical protein